MVVLIGFLGKAGTENDDLVRNLRAELREAEQDLTATREETKAIEDKLTQSKEEVNNYSGSSVLAFKALDTFGNCQRLVFALGVSQHNMHTNNKPVKVLTQWTDPACQSNCVHLFDQSQQ